MLSRRHFATKDQARRDIVRFADAYNHQRRHSSCEMLPPVAYERVLAARAAQMVGHSFIDELYSPVHHDLDEALARHGVAVADVTTVITSHLHFDHCGQNHRFTGARVIVQQSEFEAATPTCSWASTGRSGDTATSGLGSGRMR